MLISKNLSRLYNNHQIVNKFLYQVQFVLKKIQNNKSNENYYGIELMIINVKMNTFLTSGLSYSKSIISKILQV